MNQKEKEHAVLLVSSGIHTYKQLKEHGVNVYDAASSYSNLLYTQNNEASFRDDTVFALTEHGEDILYQVQKDSMKEQLARESIEASRTAALWAKIAVAVTITIYIADVLRSL